MLSRAFSKKNEVCVRFVQIAQKRKKVDIDQTLCEA